MPCSPYIPIDYAHSFVDCDHTYLDYTNFYANCANKYDDCANTLNDSINIIANLTNTLDKSFANMCIPNLSLFTNRNQPKCNHSIYDYMGLVVVCDWI